MLFAGIRGFNNTQADRIEAARSCRVPRAHIRSDAVPDIARYAQAVRVWNTAINGTSETFSLVKAILDSAAERDGDWQIAAVFVFLRSTTQSEVRRWSSRPRRSSTPPVRPVHPPARTDRPHLVPRSLLLLSGVTFSVAAAVAAPFRVHNHMAPFSGISNIPLSEFMCPKGNTNPLCPPGSA